MSTDDATANWIDEVVARLSPGDHAVFDADGTLWSGDIGEGFHEALVAEGVLAPETLAEYARLLSVDYAEAYAYGTRCLAGLDAAWLRERAGAYFLSHYARRVFPEMRALLSALAGAGVTPWVASASYRRLVEAGARHLGIPAERVFAMTLREANGRTTDELERPLVTREGKAQLLAARFSPLPALVAGNSANDLPMLRLAQKAALVVNGEDGRDPKTGDDLMEEARARGWLRRTLRPPRGAETPGTDSSGTSTA